MVNIWRFLSVRKSTCRFSRAFTVQAALHVTRRFKEPDQAIRRNSLATRTPVGIIGMFALWDQLLSLEIRLQHVITYWDSAISCQCPDLPAILKNPLGKRRNWLRSANGRSGPVPKVSRATEITINYVPVRFKYS